jgi:hypothetical protein
VNVGDLDALVGRHRAAITRVLPEAEVQVTGSTLLGGFAGHDVDLVVLVPDVAAAAQRLRQAYSPLYQDDWRDDWAAFRDPGPPQVDIVLTTEGTRGDAHHRRAWELLLGDADLRAEYVRAKAAGMTGEQKRAFFERVVARLDG